jgi:methionyl-tRNA synthetase
VSATRPWEQPANGERLDGVLVVLLEACARIAHELHPFLPDAAARIEVALERRDPELGRSLFRKLRGSA